MKISYTTGLHVGVHPVGTLERGGNSNRIMSLPISKIRQFGIDINHPSVLAALKYVLLVELNIWLVCVFEFCRLYNSD